MGLQLVTPPALEPVTLSQAKTHLRVDFDDDDAAIAMFISAARERVEDITYSRLITQTLLLTQDAFPWAGYVSVWPSPWQGLLGNAIELLNPPVQSITQVQYVDTNNVTQTLAGSALRLDSSSKPTRLSPAPGTMWPITAPITAAVATMFVAGYGATGDFVPPRFIEAIKLLCGHYYLNREEILSGTRIVALEIPEGIDDLLRRDAPPLVA